MFSIICLHDSHLLLDATLTQPCPVKRADDNCDKTSIFSLSLNALAAFKECKHKFSESFSNFNPICSSLDQSGDF